MDEKPARYTVAPMTMAFARQIVTWRYPPPYDLYNHAAGAEENAVALAWEFCDPALDYHAVITAEPTTPDELIGYCCFGGEAQVPGGDYRAAALDIGVGMSPAFTGRGRGHDFTGAVIAYGLMRDAPAWLRVTVAAFNGRSQRTFLGHGFVEEQRFMSLTQYPREFRVLVRAAELKG